MQYCHICPIKRMTLVLHLPSEQQAFGSVASMEAAYFAATGAQLLLSEQNLIDCAWDYGNTGCLGGFQELAYKYMADVLQIATEEVGCMHPSPWGMVLHLYPVCNMPEWCPGRGSFGRGLSFLMLAQWQTRHGMQNEFKLGGRLRGC